MLIRSHRRAGFTLVELLVVIAIIAVLVSLLGAALAHAYAVARDLDCYNDIAQLHMAVGIFISNPELNRPQFLPSEIDFNSDGGRDYLRRLPRNLASAMPKAKLQGDQLLVLMLAGPNQQGWQVGADRVAPYPFKKERLVDPDGSGYPVYRDTYGQPIAYFSPWHWNGQSWACTGYGNDCPRLGVQPYANESPGSWQIISAGRNQRFGTAGATWTPGAAPSVYPAGSDGADDFANFSYRLGRAR